MRQAVVHYRALFAELLEVEERHEDIPARSQTAVPSRTTTTTTTTDKHYMETQR